jgi:hypothetical protein
VAALLTKLSSALLLVTSSTFIIISLSLLVAVLACLTLLFRKESMRFVSMSFVFMKSLTDDDDEEEITGGGCGAFVGAPLEIGSFIL